MEAGRELDAKVAEALGYTREERKIAVNDDPWNGYVIGEKWYNHIPRFSTDWGAMGVLVEEAAKQGFPFQIETRFMDGGLIDYRCLSIGEDRDIVHGFGDTAPQAVCRAFLKAKGVEI